MHKRPIFILLLIIASTILKANSKKKDIAQLFNEAKYQDVIDLANSNLAKDSINFEAYYYKGLAEQSLYKFSEAVNSFENAVRFTEDKSLVLFLLGTAQESAGNNIKAINTYKSIILLDSLHIPAKARLAKVYKSQKDYIQAIEMFSDLVKLDTNNGYFYSQLAYCCNKFGFNEPVITYYKKAIELNPFNN